MKEFLIALIFLCLCTDLDSKSFLPDTNFDIFNKLSSQYIDYFEKEIRSSNNQQDSITTFSIVKSPYSYYFEAILVEKLTSKGWRLRNYDLDISNYFSTQYTFAIFSFDINYSKIPKGNKINRKIKIDFRCTENSRASFLRPINKVIAFTDTISEELIDYIEKEGPPFTAPKPKDDATFIEKFIEPIGIIGASALIILLFFSIRSN